MSYIHELSPLTPLAELDLFEIPPTQDSILEDIETYHRPNAAVDINKMIVFEFTTGENEYWRPTETELFLKAQISLKKTGDASSTNWEGCCVVNNIAHALFRHCQIEINGRALVRSFQTYHYKSYFETLFGYTDDAKKSHLTMQGWFRDQDGTQNITGVNPTKTALIKPTTITNETGSVFLLLCKLHIDVMMQPKLLPRRLKIVLTLYPNSKEFYLKTSSSSYVPFLSLLEAGLYVHSAKVSDFILRAHQLALTKGTAKYAINRGEVTYHTIDSGKSQADVPNICHGRLPRVMYVAFVYQVDFLGKLSSNPFYFQNLNIIDICAYVDRKAYPNINYNTDFSNDDYLQVRQI